MTPRDRDRPSIARLGSASSDEARREETHWRHAVESGQGLPEFC